MSVAYALYNVTDVKTDHTGRTTSVVHDYDEDDEINPYLELLEQTPMEIWPSLSALPLWEFEKESKLGLSMQPCPVTEELREEFRQLFIALLDKYGPDRLYVPPPNSCENLGTRYYNDGGTVKEDRVKPENSYSSGFLYQKCITKPLQLREVWLPGKRIKHSNNFIFAVLKPIVYNIPYVASDKDDFGEIYEAISKHPKKDRVQYFDIKGFGLQYPRPYLQVMLEEIGKRYNHPELQDEINVAIDILSNVDLQMEDGTFVYPPRGIGLGYYEDLKMLGMIAILDRFEPVSLFGDQGLIPIYPKKHIFGKGFFVKEIYRFGHLMDIEKVDIWNFPRYTWGGHFTELKGYIEPRSAFTSLIGAWHQKTHWERKGALRSYSPIHTHVWRRVAFWYEISFGYEFFKGESMLHPDNLGVNQSAIRQEGWLRDWRVSRLTHPKVVDDGNFLYELPFQREDVTQKEALDFSIKRKFVYATTKANDSILIDYVHPRITLNKKRKPAISQEARAMPLHQEIRSLVLYGQTTHKLVSCLDAQEAKLAAIRQSFAVDPFYARSTGGYRIDTPYHRPHCPSEELLDIVDASFQAGLRLARYAYRRDKVVPGVHWDDHLDELQLYRPKSPERELPPPLDTYDQEIINILKNISSTRDLDVPATYIEESNNAAEYAEPIDEMDYGPSEITKNNFLADYLTAEEAEAHWLPEAAEYIETPAGEDDLSNFMEIVELSGESHDSSSDDDVW
jgi:hypothetical protein